MTGGFETCKRRLVHWLASRGYFWYRIHARLQKRRVMALYPDHRGARPAPRDGSPQERLVVGMIDPRPGRSGGFVGRLNAIISIYWLCRQHGWRFGVWFKTPFVLEDYLLPNRYDWRVSEQQLDRAHAEPIVCYFIGGRAMRYARRWIERRAARHATSHVYAHLSLYDPRDYARLYRELFRPAPALETLVEQHTGAIGGGYVASVFRFQQLLGDFSEGDYPTLSATRREELIAACLRELGQVRALHPDHRRMLVTSDSRTFLERAAEAFEWVYTIAGERVHMDYVSGHTDAHMASLVDFYMIGGASKVYQLRTGQMYGSSFPEAAAAMGGVPYVERKF